MKLLRTLTLALAALTLSAAAHATTLSYSASGATSTGGTYSVSFTAALTTPTATSLDGLSVFYLDFTDGVETTLSVLLDGTKIFDESTAGVYSVTLSNDGSLRGIELGGNVGGTGSYSVNSAPDILASGASNFFSGAYQPTPGSRQQIQFQLTTDVSVEFTEMSAIPLPAGGLLLLSALGLGAVLRHRRAA